MIDKIKEAVNAYRRACSLSTASEIMLDLAERYMAVEAEMPAKKVCEGCGKAMTVEELKIGKYVSCCPDGKYSEHLYNQAINDCTIITTKLLAEKDKEIYSLKFQNDCKSDLCECSDIYVFPFKKLDGIEEIIQDELVVHQLQVDEPSLTYPERIEFRHIGSWKTIVKLLATAIREHLTK